MASTETPREPPDYLYNPEKVFISINYVVFKPRVVRNMELLFVNLLLQENSKRMAWNPTKAAIVSSNFFATIAKIIICAFLPAL